MMKHRSAAASIVVVGMAAGAMAQPSVNGAHLNTRVFNDFPNSNLSTINNYPSQVQISDGNLVGTGFANRHNWRFSSDGGASDTQFQNADRFSFSADLTLSGSGNGEAGIQLTPWFSEQVDGVLYVNGVSGEVAAFGGRLPFYSFTVAQGVHYTLGDTVHLGIEYDPHSLTAGDPGQIRYTYNNLTSGWINFDQGNPAEDPPHGLWGILSPAEAGGYMQAPGANVGTGTLVANFANIVYIPSPASLSLLALGGLAASRRRRHA